MVSVCYSFFFSESVKSELGLGFGVALYLVVSGDEPWLEVEAAQLGPFLCRSPNIIRYRLFVRLATSNMYHSRYLLPYRLVTRPRGSELACALYLLVQSP
jgi:hypothetical protein